VFAGALDRYLRAYDAASGSAGARFVRVGG
jgi:hypothetical protein